MSTVNAPFPASSIHYADGVHTSSHGLCGTVVLGNNWTADDSKVTCVDCNVRILALLQGRQNVLIQNIARHLKR